MADEPQDDELAAAPLGGTRAQAMQRLQVGVFGLASMILMIALANIILNQARETEAGVVPEAAPTTAPSGSASPASDPLADAGVAPDIPSEPQPTPDASADATITPGD